MREFLTDGEEVGLARSPTAVPCRRHFGELSPEAGIPFVLGFWGKMYVFLAAAKAGMWGLVFLGALLAVVALYYYLNVARWMFIVSDDGPTIRTPTPILIALIICALLVVGGGLIPRLFVDPAMRAVAGF